jgi:hypothetical protein
VERDLLLGLPVGVGEDRDVLPLFILLGTGIGYWVLGIGYWVLGIGYWVLGIGYNYELQYLVGFIMCVEERRSPEKYHEA